MTYEQLSLINQESVGSYGATWMNWMECNHKKKVREMKAKKTFLSVARSVDADACKYRELLDREYERFYPRPATFDEIRKWEFTKAYYNDGTVMRERVLIPVTTP